MRGVALVCFGLSAVTVAGCSSASYQQQISDLSTALTNVQSSFNSLSQSEQQAFVASQTALALQKGNQILIPAQCSDVQSTKSSAINCIPVIYNGQTKKSRILVYKSAAPNALKLASSVAGYGTKFCRFGASSRRCKFECCSRKG